MRQTIITLVLLLTSLTFATEAAAGIGLEYSSSANTTENLFGDSNTVYDTYTAENIILKAYPWSSIEIKLGGEFNHYRETPGLDNKAGNLAVTYIPLGEESPLSLYFSGALSGRSYRYDYSILDNNYGEMTAAAAYRLSPAMVMRSGINFRSTAYISRNIDYRKDVDIFMGGNVSLFGQSSFDVEIGAGRTNYAYKDANLTGSALLPPPLNPIVVPYSNWRMNIIPQTKGNLWIFYVSPRISRSLGSKTGISLQYTQRNFQNYGGDYLPGQANDYLSPWITIWDGNSIVLNLKSYLLPRFVVTAGAGYWDKTYLTTANELNPDGIDLYYYQAQAQAKTRRDWQSRFYISFQLPMKLGADINISPALNFDYTRNVSNDPLYYFENFAISTGLTFRM